MIFEILHVPQNISEVVANTVPRSCERSGIYSNSQLLGKAADAYDLFLIAVVIVGSSNSGFGVTEVGNCTVGCVAVSSFPSTFWYNDV